MCRTRDRESFLGGHRCWKTGGSIDRLDRTSYSRPVVNELAISGYNGGRIFIAVRTAFLRIQALDRIRVKETFCYFCDRKNWFRITYQHGRFRRIHRNGWRIGRRSSCRSRSCPPCYRTVCPPRTLCTCCRGSRPRASAYPCTTNPANDSSPIIVCSLSPYGGDNRFRFV